ncbi:endopeptidase La [Dethiosulfovibrio salsuginis]|uniref:Lon protease n=1 Tax=Dethiosulfovibrio salsuginis TaxID=561720 RepID=A0A1X7I4X5_9BACT|nr:endopeptidase La [Dethiosulfovibrio salsuginis]SMG09264.1 ATP-dependent Lon protease [Dethiosulfovibrio salsuginis]
MLYVLPVRDMVMFPGAIAPLFVGRPRSLKAIELSVLEDRKIFVATQKDLSVDDPEGEDIYSVGTLCNILQMIRVPDGSTKILLEGLERMKVNSYSKGKEAITAEAVPLETGPWEKDEKIEALKRTVVLAFEEYVNLHPKLPTEILISVGSVKDFDKMSDLLASHLTVDLEVKQGLLECNKLEDRLELMLRIILEENELLKLEHQIHSRVQQELEQSQRQYYLKEQLKVIRSELGQDDSDSEMDDYYERIEKASLPEEVEEKAKEELKRLSKMPSMSAEATVVRSYIDWILNMPWNSTTEDILDLSRVGAVLDSNHHGLEKVKERLLEFIAVRKLAGEKSRGGILCLVGPPGVGKTSLGRSVADAMGRKFVSLSLGGVRDEAEIRGHRRTYIGSMPGRIIQKIKQAGTKNPIVLMDEIDKLGNDFRGDPASALLEVLDPKQNYAFTDHYLEVPFDLSQVLFITTANITHSIPKALLDRMEVIDLSGYVMEEKVRIAKKHLFPKLLEENGLKRKDISISDGVYKKIVQEYTREAGVRNLERKIATICRKATMQIVRAQGHEELNLPVAVTAKNLKDFLGAPKKYDLRLPKTPRRGIALGLAWTQTGGEVLVIEAVSSEGKGQITLTGNLGAIMQESAQTAMGYLKGHAAQLGLKGINWSSFDVHLHVPEGAIPKDGPSAGITMAVVILSVIAGRRYRPEVAMTGEISLLGQVLPIGGVREKILAAKRHGIKTLIVPEGNRPDIEELEDWVTEGLRFVFASTVKEVFKHALEVE